MFPIHSQADEEIRAALRKAAWLGLSRSMIVGSIVQAVLFFISTSFSGPVWLWKLSSGITSIVMFALYLLSRRFDKLERFVYGFMLINLSLGLFEASILLWTDQNGGAVAIINLIAGFSILSTLNFVGLLAVSTIAFLIWMFSQTSQVLMGVNASVFLISVAYSFVMNSRYKQNLLKQIYHAKALEERTQELEQLHQKYERLSQTDELTETFNRRYFLQEAERYIALSKRHQMSFSILIFDLDHFKAINDNKGHLVGDKVLKEVARRVKQTLRESDIFARYGGEEFVVLLPFTELEQALIVSERLRKLIAEKPIMSQIEEVWVSSSFGLAVSKENCNLESMLIRADKALYAAKDKGRNRIEVAEFDPVQLKALVV